MRWISFSLVLFGIAAPLAQADPQNLAGGALIAHYVPGLGMRYGPPSECESYASHGQITSCEEQTNSVQVSNYLLVTWYVVAAFEEDKEWCGVQFGLGEYDPRIMGIFDWSACYPGSGLEIPSAGWPGPGEGIAFVTTDTPWTGNWKAVCMFAGYAYSYFGSGVMPLVPDPSVSQPFAGFANCDTPPLAWDAELGGFGINEPGTWACWGWENYVCCVGNECAIVGDEEECIALGGAFHPEWDDCGPPNPCVSTPVSNASWGSIKALYR